jgi:hypothetical protein
MSFARIADQRCAVKALTTRGVWLVRMTIKKILDRTA